MNNIRFRDVVFRIAEGLDWDGKHKFFVMYTTIPYPDPVDWVTFKTFHSYSSAKRFLNGYVLGLKSKAI